MKMLQSFRRLLIPGLFMCFAVTMAQVEEVESFNVSGEVVVKVNTSYTNVILETWNKNKVEVTARVEGEDLTEAEAREILESWDYDVLGNSKKVVITSNAGGSWYGLESLEGLQGLEGLKALGDMDFDFNFNIPEMNFDFDIPEIPEFEDFPNWPFTENQPSIKHKGGYMNYNVRSDGDVFDQNEYEKNKKAYVAKLNKKYGTNVSVSEVDRWLEDVEVWGEEFGKVMEDWGQEFGDKFGEQFGEDFEIKMERWGEQFGKDMEKWGEEFGEKFAKDWEKWGEEFGEKFAEDMEKWGEEFSKDMEKFGEEFEQKYGKDMEKWAEEFAKRFEENGSKFNNQFIVHPPGKKTFIIKEGKSGNYKKVKANKTLIIKMPKNSKTEIDVRHGELKMADAYNIRANLNYSTLTANSIDGGNTLINVAYAPVQVREWLDGALFVKFVDECDLNSVGKINLDSNSSNVTIDRVVDEAMLSGSFGDIKINMVGDGFKELNLNLDNSDVFISLPRTAFKFDFNGKKTTILYPKGLNVDQSKRDGIVVLTGFAGNRNASKNFKIKARYCNIKLQ